MHDYTLITIVNCCKHMLVVVSIKSILAIGDLERKDVNLDLIKIERKGGGMLEDT
jgi:T-complex protein 1 subunit epsilon